MSRGAPWMHLALAAAVLLGLVALAAPTIGRADPSAPEARLEEAIALYRDALDAPSRDERIEAFRRAALRFRAVAESGHGGAALLTNLGNAALQGEQLGQAILAYRQALLAEPGHPRARQNLDHARTLLPEWVPTPASALGLDSALSWESAGRMDQRALLAALIFAAAGALVALALARGSTAARSGAISLFGLWLLLLASVQLDPSRRAHAEGVIVGDEVIARAADSLGAPSRFGDTLPAGTEVRILEDRGGWLQIELHNGRNAWVLSSALARIGGDPEA